MNISVFSIHFVNYLALKYISRSLSLSLSLLFKDNYQGEGERERVNAVPDWNKAIKQMKRHCWRMFQFYDIIAHVPGLRKYAWA